MRATVILSMAIATCLFTGCGSESADQYRGLPSSNTWAGPDGTGSSATSWSGGGTSNSSEPRISINNPFGEPVTVPIPGQKVDSSSLERIVTGVTTQTEAERILGQPKRTTTQSDGSRVCFYVVCLQSSSTGPGWSNERQTLTTVKVVYGKDGKVAGVERHSGEFNFGG